MGTTQPLHTSQVPPNSDDQVGELRGSDDKDLMKFADFADSFTLNRIRLNDKNLGLESVQEPHSGS